MRTFSALEALKAVYRPTHWPNSIWTAVVKDSATRCVGVLAEEALLFENPPPLMLARSFSSTSESPGVKVGVREEILEFRSKHCRNHLGRRVVVSYAAKQMYPRALRADLGVIEGHARVSCF